MVKWSYFIKFWCLYTLICWHMIDFYHTAGLPTVLIILVTTLKLVIKYVVAEKLLRYRRKTINSDVIMKKYQTTLYRLIYGVISITVGMYVLYDEKWILKLDFTPDLKDEVIPLKYKVYYALCMCFYIIELSFIPFEPTKHDSLQMILHHLGTLVLMYLSYNPKYIKFGVLILPLNNITDPMLSFCKLCDYLKDELCANVGLFVFSVSFIPLRLLVYPRYMLWNAWKFSQQDQFRSPAPYILTLLFMLQIMNIIWTMYLIILFVKVIKGEKLKDPREAPVKKD